MHGVYSTLQSMSNTLHDMSNTPKPEQEATIIPHETFSSVMRMSLKRYMHPNT